MDKKWQSKGKGEIKTGPRAGGGHTMKGRQGVEGKKADKEVRNCGY